MPNDFGKLATRHTAAYALITGALVAVFLAAVGASPALAAGAGGTLSVLTWILWRKGGVARRMEPDNEEPVDWSNVAKFVLVACIAGAIAFVALVLAVR